MDESRTVGNLLPVKHSERKSGRRWAAYMRVSTPEQDINLQKYAIERWAKALPPEDEVYYFEEKASSRKTRPIKNKIYQEALKRQWDGIVVYHIDRWGRNLSEILLDFDALANKKVIIEVMIGFGRIDMESPIGRLTAQIFAAFAEFERNLIRARITDSLREKKAHGAKLGRPKGSKDKESRRKGGYFLRWQSGKFTRHQPEVQKTGDKQSSPVKPGAPADDRAGPKQLRGSLHTPEQKVINKWCPGCGKDDFVCNQGLAKHSQTCKVKRCPGCDKADFANKRDLTAHKKNCGQFQAWKDAHLHKPGQH